LPVNRQFSGEASNAKVNIGQSAYHADGCRYSMEHGLWLPFAIEWSKEADRLAIFNYVDGISVLLLPPGELANVVSGRLSPQWTRCAWVPGGNELVWYDQGAVWRGRFNGQRWAIEHLMPCENQIVFAGYAQTDCALGLELDSRQLVLGAIVLDLENLRLDHVELSNNENYRVGPFIGVYWGKGQRSLLFQTTLRSALKLIEADLENGCFREQAIDLRFSGNVSNISVSADSLSIAICVDNSPRMLEGECCVYKYSRSNDSITKIYANVKTAGWKPIEIAPDGNSLAIVDADFGIHIVPFG